MSLMNLWSKLVRQLQKDQLYLSPPAGQNKVCVDILLSELLGHKQSQRAILVVDVLLGGIAQDGVGIVDLLELLGSFWVLWVLVWVKPQRQFPKNTPKGKAEMSKMPPLPPKH